MFENIVVVPTDASVETPVGCAARREPNCTWSRTAADLRVDAVARPPAPEEEALVGGALVTVVALPLLRAPGDALGAHQILGRSDADLAGRARERRMHAEPTTSATTNRTHVDGARVSVVAVGGRAAAIVRRADGDGRHVIRGDTLRTRRAIVVGVRVDADTSATSAGLRAHVDGARVAVIAVDVLGALALRGADGDGRHIARSDTFHTRGAEGVIRRVDARELTAAARLRAHVDGARVAVIAVDVLGACAGRGTGARRRVADESVAAHDVLALAQRLAVGMLVLRDLVVRVVDRLVVRVVSDRLVVRVERNHITVTAHEKCSGNAERRYTVSVSVDLHLLHPFVETGNV